MLPIIALAAQFYSATTPPAPNAPAHRRSAVEIYGGAYPDENLTRLNATVAITNARHYKVTAYPIDATVWFTHPDRNGTRTRPKPAGRAVWSMDRTVTGQENGNTRNQTYQDSFPLPTTKAGTYLVLFDAKGAEAWSVATVSAMSLVVRRSYNRTLVWATETKTGHVIPGVGVRVINFAGALLAKGTTGPDGACLEPVQVRKCFVVVSHGSDVVGIPTEVANPNGSLQCLLITDRPIYRPGQNIHFKGVLRLTDGQGYRVAANRKVGVRLRNLRGIVIDRQQLTTNALGSVEGAFALPKSAFLSQYTIELECAGQTQNHSVTVEEYRKPEFDVSVKGAKNRYFSGQDIHFKINADYYFGAAVKQAQVAWSVSHTLDSVFLFDSSGEDEDNGYSRGIRYQFGGAIAQGSAATDAHGNLDVVIHTKPGEPDGQYTLTAVVTDSSRRQVSGSGSVSCTQASVKIGVTVGSQFVSLGQFIPVEVQIQDLDGKNADADVEVSAYPHRFDSKLGWLDGKLMARVVGRARDGKVTLRVPALQGGRIKIVATTVDRNGRRTSDTTFAYVDDQRDHPGPKQEDPTVDLKLDKTSYRPGEMVKAFVTTNRPNRPVLIVESGGDLWGYKVVIPNRQVGTAEFRTDTRYSPTLDLTASMPDPKGLVDTEREIKLPDPKRALRVTITADKKEYRAGDPAGLHVRTTDSAGRGVPADLALGVADESLYSLAADTNEDPIQFFWGDRDDKVQSFPESLTQGYDGVTSAAYGGLRVERNADPTLGTIGIAKSPGPASAAYLVNGSRTGEDMSGFGGGAPKAPSIQQKIRQLFQDTAYWNSFVETDASGKGAVKFDLPDDLASWRASGTAATAETRVGSGRTTLLATRPVTFRLAAPRVIAEGDQLTLIGTLNNRTDRNRTYDIDLAVSDGDGSYAVKGSVFAKAHDSATTSLNVIARLPESGSLVLSGRVLAEGATSAEDGDAVQIKVPVIPRGVMESTLTGGTIEHEKEIAVDLPADTLPQGSMVTVILTSGLNGRIGELAHDLMSSDPYGTLAAADMLKAAVAIHANAKSAVFRDAYSKLSDTYSGGGWGWWGGSPVDPIITSEVGYTLGLVARSGYQLDGVLRGYAVTDCDQLYHQSNRWEDKCRLAAALSMLGAPIAPSRLKDVLAHGQKLSPFAKLRLAEVLSGSDRPAALKLLSQVLPLISEGAEATILPVGDELGWSASTTQSTAELLRTLHLLAQNPDLQSRIVRGLALPESGAWRCDDDNADVVIALAGYASVHSAATKIGVAHATVNGSTSLPVPSVEHSGESLELTNLLHAGRNVIRITRTGDGDAFYTIRTQAYRPDLGESVRGVRVSRRFETKNAAGIWSEITKPIKAGSEVRCTVVVWGDDIPDAIRVTEPVPAGFEFIQDDDESANTNEEQRDGRMIHYFVNSGSPTVLRYYLRAETDGSLIALPAVAEYLRRPAVQGHSSATLLTVKP